MPTVFAYCTLSDVRSQVNMASTITSGDSALQDYIYTASEAINDYCDAIFAPVIQTRYYGLRSVDSYSGLLTLNADLIELSGVSFDGTAQDVTNYAKSPAGAYPVNFVYGTAWQSTKPNDIGITGTWFYTSNYANSWYLQGTLSGDINASVTTIPIINTGLEVGQILQVNDELMAITSIAGGIITAQRGANGSTASAHTTGDVVEYFRPERVIKQACARWAGLMYTRQAGFENVQFNPDGTTIQYPNDIPADVRGILDRLRIGLRITTV